MVLLSVASIPRGRCFSISSRPILSTRRNRKVPIIRISRLVHSSKKTSQPEATEAAVDGTPVQEQHDKLPFSAASQLGLDPAQNKRHCPLVYHEEYSFEDWPPNHTFPMNKFERLANAILNNPIDLEDDTEEDIATSQPLVLDPSHFFRPLDFTPANLPKIQSWLCGPLDPTFVDRFLYGQLSTEEARRIGFREQTARVPLIRRTVLEVVGTLLTTQLAMQYGMAVHLAGGTHHARHDRGAGYTILNDLVVAAHQVLLLSTTTSNNNNTSVEKVLVIDCDVHQGDGTAHCMHNVPFLNDDKLFTLSLHCASNYPHPKAISTYDIGLPDKMEDTAYQEVLEESVNRALTEVQPDVVLYDAGVDIYKGDTLGRLHVSEQGIRNRDRFVLEACLLRQIPVAAVIGGGYDVDVDALARRHAMVHEEASRLWREHELWNNNIKSN